MTTRWTEPAANAALGDALDGMLPAYSVRWENTRQIVDQPGLQPDILITAPGRAPVVIEAEFLPAYTAEPEAKSRLNLEVDGTGKLIDAAIALRYPDGVADAPNLADAVRNARLSYAALYADDTRFPESGWLEGSVEDLSDLVRLLSVPQRAVDEAADALEKGIDRAASILQQLAESKPGIVSSIAELLGMSEVLQTYRMAGAMVANAMIFHERLAGLHGVKPLSQVCSTSAPSPKRGILEAWTEILDINYWPIFAIARDIVEQLPTAEATQLLTNLRTTVEDVEATGANQAHDLTGRIFQRLIADRKYLATFYTLPSSAALLAKLAVSKLDVDWSDADAIAKLRIGDFACGTGALLGAVYEQIATMHERSGGDLAKLHPVMMEEVLYGCDVMPSAIHITGSTLSGAQPRVGFGNTRLYTLAYGRQEGLSARQGYQNVRIGSLELLQSSAILTLFNMSDPAKQTGSVGEQTATQILAEVQDKGFDLVIMNPPFTSNTKHYDADDGVLNAAFAAYDSSEDEQKWMADRLKRFAKGSTYHGHAGLGSVFASLGHRKLKPGGVLALVLPFTAINGSSWSKFRKMISDEYTDISIVSISANGMDMSFSSDTGIAECLVIGIKRASGERAARARFISLRQRPRGFAEAHTIANDIPNSQLVRSVESGPYGGTLLNVGDDLVGEILDTPISNQGWGAARISDASVAQVAYSLANGRLWLPAQSSALDLPMARLNEIGQRGFDHQMFTSGAHKGPFTRAQSSPTATYPSLWNHNAKNETRIVCKPDSQLQVKQGMETRAVEVWKTASRAHLNADFRFTSQPLAFAFTDRESIGGRAWPNVKFNDERLDYAFATWGNSTLGLLCYWWHSSRQQDGRGSISIRSAETLPTLDLRALTDAQLTAAKSIFDDFRERELKPAYLADADPNRAYLDRRVVCDLLGFDDATYRAVRLLSAKWCAEPSVHGGKRRPKGAELAV